MLRYPVNLERGPGPLLVFLPEADPDALSGAAVALTNTDGGAIVVGLAANGEYASLVDEGALRAALNQAGDCCRPAIPFAAPQLLMTPQGPVRVVYVPRGDRVHALEDGRVLVRTGFGNRVLSGDEIRRLLTGKSSGDFEAEVVPGARIADLDPALLADFLLQRAHRTGQRWSAPGEEGPLLDVGAVTPDYRVTVAGMLLFGREPQRWLPHSGARFARLLTEDGAQVSFERRLSGALPRLLDALWDAIRDQLREPAPGPDGSPHEEYPVFAVREALVNAACHRDYRLHEASLIRLYPGRLEISSPGGLPGFLSTTEALIGGRYSRNPRLSWCLYQWGYGAEPGAGVLNILNSMDRFGHRPPEFLPAPYRLTVRLYRAGEVPGADSRRALSPQQQAILDYVGRHGSINLRECAVLYPAHRPDRLQQDLTALVEGERLLRIGARTGAYYILP